MKDKFVLGSNLISEFLADFSTWNDEGSMIKEIIQANNEDGNEFDLSMLEGLEHWRFNIKSDYCVHDGDNNDNFVTIINPETGDGYFGGDNHNSMNGWSDVTMTFIKYDPTTDMVEISKAELDEMKERIFWLECLENAGVDNWTGIEYAYDLKDEYSNKED